MALIVRFACLWVCSLSLQAAVFTVTHVQDDGPGSLRRAIQDANQAPEPPHRIEFNIPGPGVKTIRILSALPTLVTPLEIDGFSQPGARANRLFIGSDAVHLIELNGSQAGLFSSGLSIGDTTVTIRGLVINQFSESGIFSSITYAGKSKILGNLIGTDATGTVALGNKNGMTRGTTYGLTIGTSLPADRNVFSGNHINGIYFSGGPGNIATDSIVHGNYIGVDASGSRALGNGGDGLYFSFAGATSIGGRGFGEGNVLSANGGSGLACEARGFVSAIKGNRFGTDAGGGFFLGNREHGLVIVNTDAPVVGGPLSGEENLIAGNKLHGIWIGYNGYLYRPSIPVLRNSIWGNEKAPQLNLQNFGFTANTEPDETITLNDSNDADEGANGLQNFPLISNLTTSQGVTTVQGSLHSQPNKAYRIDLYRSRLPDIGNYGPGEIHVGTVTNNTDSHGNLNFAISTTSSLVGQSLTATATSEGGSEAGSTSEFSRAVNVPGIFGGQLQFKSWAWCAFEGTSRTLEVIRSGSSSKTVSVQYATSDGSALTGSDFGATSGTLVFGPGETVKTISIPILADPENEAPEIFEISLSSPGNSAGLGFNKKAFIQILDGSAPVEFSVASSSISEGDSGVTMMPFRVSLLWPTTSAVQIQYETVSGTAQAGTDFQATSGTFTFAPGEMEKTIQVPIIGNTMDENLKEFTVVLHSPSTGSVTQPLGRGLITNDDYPPFLSVGDVSMAEGDTGKQFLTFEVILSAPSGKEIKVNFQTRDNTASSSMDYHSASGELVFVPGEISKGVSVEVLGDFEDEGDEKFFLELSAPVNSLVADGSAFGAILDDDGPLPTISVTEGSRAEGQDGFQEGFLRARLTPATNRKVSFSFSTEAGSADPESDYLVSSGTLQFEPGQTEVEIPVILRGDTNLEPKEHFWVRLLNPTNALLDEDLVPFFILNDDGVLLEVVKQANRLVFSWPDNNESYFLEYTEDFQDWFFVQTAPTLTNGRWEVEEPTTSAMRFYRLLKQ